MYKYFIFKKLCMHFYIFDELVLKDSVFFTNFIQVMGGFTITNNYDNLQVNYDELQHYSLEDMFSNDNYMLFSVLLPIYQWKKK